MTETKNDALLASCDFPHDFRPYVEEHELCEKCGGVLASVDAQAYRNGLARAGEFHRKKKGE